MQSLARQPDLADLTSDQWALVEQILAVKTGKQGQPLSMEKVVQAVRYLTSPAMPTPRAWSRRSMSASPAAGSPRLKVWSAQADKPEPGSLMGVAVQGTGGYLAETVVSNADLQDTLGCDPDWILQRTGIRERRQARPDQATSDLCAEAGRRCLASAGLAPAAIDLLLVATFTPDMQIPSTACLVQDRLGLRCPAFDIQAACAGFVYALVTGATYIVSGACRRVLIIGGDCVSRAANPRDPKTYPLFSDGAGAVLLGAGSSEQGLLGFSLGADGGGASLLNCPAGGSRKPHTAESLAQGLHYMQMNGPAVFRWAVDKVAASIRHTLADCGLAIEEIDWFLLHQANLRLINAVVEAAALPSTRVYCNVERNGNTSAASIPLALDELNAAGKLQSGQRLLLSGFGAGLTWGTIVLHW